MSDQGIIIGRRLKELRKEKKLRQSDVAEHLNVSRQTISKYERGEREPDYYMLIKIADYYGVSIDFLFGWTPVRGVSRFDESQWKSLFGFMPSKVADESLD